MFRLICLLPTIAALLACPFNCLGMAADRDATSPQVASCACCHAAGCAGAERTSSSEVPPAVPSEDDCGCASCLCHGAVLSRCMLPDDFGAPLADAMATTSRLIGVVAEAPSGKRRSGPPERLPDGSGRALRLACASLQI